MPFFNKSSSNAKPFTIYSLSTLVAHRRKCVACLLFTRYPTEIIASRLYNIGCVFALGFIITILLLVESFGLKLTSDFTNSSDSKILFKCLLMVLMFLPNNSLMVFCVVHIVSFSVSIITSIATAPSSLVYNNVFTTSLFIV